MSEADANNSEDLSFDLNTSVPADEEDTSFGSFAGMEAAAPDGPSDIGFGMFGETMPSALETFPDTGVVSPDAVPADSEPFAVPSGFLTGDAAETATELEAAIPVVETPEEGKAGKRKKKEKKQKPQKEAAPREPMELGDVLSLCFGFVMFLALIVVNFLIATAPRASDIGSNTKLAYIVLVNVFGLIIVAVPFLLWKFRKGSEPHRNLRLPDVLLGIAAMAMTSGVLCFLAAFFRYGFTIK